MFISRAKFEDHCFNISGDILLIQYFMVLVIETIYDVITSVICIIQKHKYL